MRIPKLVAASGVGGIDPALVEEDKEDDVIAKAGNSVEHGHLDHLAEKKGKKEEEARRWW